MGVLIAVTVLLAVFWWRWNRGWKELESGLNSRLTPSGEQPKAHVPAEEMERLLIHRVEPQYPESARGTGLRGVIALDIVVGRDGAVLAMKPLNGPEVLARAAMDALRWWKFEPYKLNGEPIAVGTTVAVEFKP
jgi:protein TonB